MKLPLDQQVIWLSGASSGIGLALAKALRQAGAIVIASARNKEALSQLASEFAYGVVAMPCDVTSTEQCQQTAQKIEQIIGRLDTVILNAGTCEYVDFPNFDPELFKRVFNTNVFGAVNQLHAAMPLLQKSTAPYVVGVSSSASFLPFPRAEAYGSSKAAMDYLLASLRVDLTQHGFDVTTVSPGFVKTPLTDKNDFPMPMAISAPQAAQAIVKGMQKRHPQVHFPKRFTAVLKALGNLPTSWVNQLMQQTVRSS